MAAAAKPSWALPGALWLPHASQLLSRPLTLGLVCCIFIANYRNPRYLVWNKISLLAAAAAVARRTRLIRAATWTAHSLAPVSLHFCLSVALSAPNCSSTDIFVTYERDNLPRLPTTTATATTTKGKPLWQEFPLGFGTKEKCLRPEAYVRRGRLNGGWARQGNCNWLSAFLCKTC